MGDSVSCDIAVFVNCPSRQVFKNVIGIADHATKHTWVYPMKERSEAFLCIKFFAEAKLRLHECSIKHYHALHGAIVLGYGFSIPNNMY